MKLIVTGHTGTIGKHFPEKYVKSSVNLVSIKKTFGAPEDYLNSTIVHLAGLVGPMRVAENVELSRQVNVTGTIEFAERALEYGVKKFIYISTSHVYAKSDKVISESNELNPQNTYAEQKIQAEIELQRIFKSSTSSLTIVRIFSVLGWDCKEYTLGGLFQRIAQGDNDLLIKHGGDTRDFLTPKTIAATLQKMAEGNEMPGIWNLSSGKGTTVREAALTMLRQVLGDSVKDRIQDGQSETPSIVGDNSKLSVALVDTELKWQPGPYPASLL